MNPSQDIFNSEAKFEDAVIAMLQEHGWDKNVIKNPTEEELKKNWADILFQNNRDRDRLNNYPLTDGEMQQIIDHINSLGNPLDLNEFINGGTTTVRRDNPDDKEHFGKEVTLKIYDRKEIAGGDSRYQIVKQPKFPTQSAMTNNRRGDLLLLINGMPVIHIELKKSGVDVSQATNQIEKYSKEGIFSKGLFSLVQIFVAMTPTETRYFANPGPQGVFNKLFYFQWANFLNEPMNRWDDIVRYLLSIPMAHQLVGFYTIADKKDGALKVMRSYQYYASDAIRNKVAKTKWEDKAIYGGFVWHTTGSGKTMTSFKSAQLISQSDNADKVVFLMDRRELGTQSLEEYQGFASDDTNVEGTENTEILVSKLESDDPNMHLIVTSIQKMGLVYDKKRGEEGGYEKQRLDKIRNKRIVFIVDECHRSTFGDTLINIKKNFPSALYFGFTGTPIADENNKKDMTTQDIFGERLHLYSIADGIRDKNVLGFDPTFVQTFDYQDLANKVALHEVKANDLNEVFADEKKTKKFQEIIHRPWVYKDRDPFTGKYPDGIEDLLPESNYESEEHRKKVVEDIKKNWQVKSVNGKLHAILATSSIPEAIQYYRLIREEMPDIRVTAVFDPSIDNHGTQRAINKEEGLTEILTDYNDWFNQSFTIPTWDKFKKDVAKRMAHKKPYQHLQDDQTLNIMIVVDQMLTGFDSKWVNTLYLDKVIEYEYLIQAFSRTNRLFGNLKPHGQIRYYRRPYRMKRNIDDAFKLYAHGKPAGIFVLKIGQNIKAMNHCFEEIKDIFENEVIKDFSKLPDDKIAKSRFTKLWIQLNASLDSARLQGFTWKKKRYSWEDTDGKKHNDTIIFDEATYLTLAQRYKELFLTNATNDGSGSNESDEIPFEIDPDLVAINTGRIDEVYMNSKFKKFVEVYYTDYEQEILDDILQELHKIFARLPQEEQRYAQMLISDIQSGKVKREDIDEIRTLSDYIADYMARDKNDRIHRFAEALGIDENQLRKTVELHLPEETLNLGGHYKSLQSTIDFNKAKEFIEKLKGSPVPDFEINRIANNLLRNFINEGGFEIEDIEI